MIIYECDGCTMRQEADRGIKGELCKPASWFVRCDDHGERHACSRDCIDRIEMETNHKSPVIPSSLLC